MPGGAGPLAAALHLCAGGRVPGHQPSAERAGDQPGRREPSGDRGRRRRPVDLRLPRRRHPQHPRVRAGLRRCPHRGAGAELPQHPEHPRRGQRGDRQQHRAQAEGPVDRPGVRARHRPLPRRRRDRRGPLRGQRDRPAPRRRADALRGDGGLLSHQRPVAGGGGAARQGRSALPAGGRHALLRPPGGARRHGLPQGGRQPGRRGEREAGPGRAQAGRRRHIGGQDRRPRRSPWPHLLRGPPPLRRGRCHRARRGRCRAVLHADRRRRLPAGLAGRRAAGAAGALRVPGRAALGEVGRGRRSPREPGRAGGRGRRARHPRRLLGGGGAGSRHRRSRRGGLR